MNLAAVALLAVVLLAGCGSTGTGPYTGERNSTGQRHGQGTLTFADGSAYSGEWIDGKESGQGTMTYPGGGTYIGEWKDGKQNGQGTWKFSSGITATGEWKDGNLNGQGTMTWPHGDTYTGEWKDDTPHGQGMMTEANGNTYSGEFKGGLPNGQGTQITKEFTYTGEYKDGKHHGQGTMTHPDGRSWTGEFKVGLPVPYSGEFKNRDANKATLAPPATLAATTLPTATLAPPATLSELKLEPILIQPGDLPSGVSGAQVRDTAPATFDAVPDAENTIYQQFEKNGDTIGGVTVFLYEDALMVENAYSAVFSGMDTISETISKLGDKASISHLTVGPGHDLVFTRCSFVVHIRMTTNNPAVEIISYAKRLDRRLREAVCR